jgi:chromosome partitioning protein
MPKLYAFVNQKGGVGKTTSAVNIAAYIAKLGQRVLLVDLDAQANTTSSLGYNKFNIQNGIYPLLLDPNQPLSNHLLHNSQVGIDLLPATPELAGAEVELVAVTNREARLQRVLRQTQAYDYVLIDCPPALSLLTINALVAAQAVLIPVQCEYLALEGLSQLTQTINRIRSTIHPNLGLRGLILTMYDSRAALSKEVLQEVRDYFPGKVFDTIIPRNVRLAEAPSHGCPISIYAPGSSGAKAYALLTQELLQGDGVNVNKLYA